jgi:glycerol-3-phosphate dehydrogenase
LKFDHILRVIFNILHLFCLPAGMAFRKIGVTALGTLLGGTFAINALRHDEVLARVELEGKPIKRARKLPMRAEQLAALQSGEEYDILIIGGGATGAGCALDACTRGLKTALVEANDFASGTSSRSTKLIHGGVRYLQKAILGVSSEKSLET